MLDKATAREIALKYSDEVRKNLDPTKVVLFGSYVNGTPNENSDIDIAIIMNGFQGDWLKTSSFLGRLNRKISLDIEPHLLDETHDPSGFVEHIVKTGEIIFQST